jgi:hypothetical protein
LLLYNGINTKHFWVSRYFLTHNSLIPCPMENFTAMTSWQQLKRFRDFNNKIGGVSLARRGKKQLNFCFKAKEIKWIMKNGSYKWQLQPPILQQCSSLSSMVFVCLFWNCVSSSFQRSTTAVHTFELYIPHWLWDYFCKYLCSN